MGFPGGKAGAGTYQKIINQIPPHDIYVEAFLGDGAIIRRKRPALRNIGVEVDPSTAALFSGSAGHVAGWGGPSSSIEVFNCCGIEWLKHQFGLHLVGPPKVATRAEASGSGDARSSGGVPVHDRLSLDAATRARVAGTSGFGRAVDLNSTIPNLSPSWFVYCDPPYLMKSRASGRIYRHEMTDVQHVELLSVLKRLPCPVAISGYHSSLYAEALQDWRVMTFMSMTRGGRQEREYVWMNYPEPTALHDYSYLGNNKRQRERVTRKVRTWAAGLARLPVLERQAILAKLPRDPDA